MAPETSKRKSMTHNLVPPWIVVGSFLHLCVALPLVNSLAMKPNPHRSLPTMAQHSLPVDLLQQLGKALCLHADHGSAAIAIDSVGPHVVGKLRGARPQCCSRIDLASLQIFRPTETTVVTPAPLRRGARISLWILGACI